LPEGDVWQRIEPMTFPRYLAFELSHNKWLHEIRTCHLARYTSAFWRFQMLVRWGLRMRISYEMCKGRNGRLMRKEALEQLVWDIDLELRAKFLLAIPTIRPYGCEKCTYSPLNMMAASSPRPDYCERKGRQGRTFMK
jgi:hypothetical protein